MKFKLSKREMLQFDDDCNEAANECPQYRNYWCIDDRKILLGEITPKELVKHWLQCETLWKSGYSECLSQNARDIFKRYKEWKILKQAEKIAANRKAVLSEILKSGTIVRTHSNLAAQIEAVEKDTTNGNR